MPRRWSLPTIGYLQDGIPTLATLSASLAEVIRARQFYCFSVRRGGVTSTLSGKKQKKKILKG
jgi:hypothetical protein